MNISATLNVLRLFAAPSLCLPHATIPTFDHLPIPLSHAFPLTNSAPKSHPRIRAIVLDKDNCFATPHTNAIHPAYRTTFAALRAAYPGAALLIVSNSAGSSSDPSGADAAALERATGVPVLRHPRAKKPGCYPEILAYFREKGVTESAAEVVVVGDRLFTDVVMANLMGARAVWVREGPVPDFGLLSRVEKGLEGFLVRRGFRPPQPVSEFE